jgi:hypothetical protein
MLRKMVAEIIFLNPNDMNPAIAELTELDFDVEFLVDWIDDESSAVWIKACVLSELDPSGFFHWIMSVVEPLGGDVVEVGLSSAADAERYGPMRR